MGFKSFIVLLWLSIPAALAWLVRQDLRQFHAESRRQQQVCTEHGQDLAYHAGAVLRQGELLEYCDDPEALRQWRGAWRAVTRDMQRAQQKYGGQVLGHCPAASRMLDAQDQRLTAMAATLEAAARDQEYYLRGEAVLAQMASDVEVLSWQSDYYRSMPGGRGIYFYLQEELAKLETRFEAQQHERARLQRAVRTQLQSARQDQAQLQGDTAQLGTLLARDAGQTYFDSVRQRWAAFDLREQVVALLTKLTAATA